MFVIDDLNTIDNKRKYSLFKLANVNKNEKVNGFHNKEITFKLCYKLWCMHEVSNDYR